MTGERRQTLERIVEAFTGGYNAALEETDLARLAARLRIGPAPWTGFAFEGTGMGLWLLDSVFPGRRDRWARFRAQLAPEHDYLLHVGAGWALARLGQRFEPRTETLDPLLRWLVLDGAGFHQGYFHPERYHERHERPALSPEAARVFDQGLGRSLWFMEGSGPAGIVTAIEGFHPERREDLWSGVGLACAYAGGVSSGEAEELFRLAGAAAPHFAQGVAFAVGARARAANPTEHTDRLCRLVWDRDPVALAACVERARASAEPQGRGAYATWRARLRAEWIAEHEGACGAVS